MVSDKLRLPFTRRSGSFIPFAFRALLLAALLAVFFSCGNRISGYAVVIWSPDDTAVQTGAVVPVRSFSERERKAIIMTGESKDLFSLASWRIRLFETQEEAQAFAREFDPYRSVMARSNKGALPVREEPDVRASRVYGLRDQEVIKVLGRTTQEEIDLNGLRGYWYHVLTENGTEGYTFSEMLTVFDPTQKTAEQESDKPSIDENIERFLSNTWRPDYYKDMIVNHNFDLSRFSARYGVFPNKELKEISVVTPFYSAVFPYDTITKVSSEKYVLDRSSFQIFFRGSYVAIQYGYNGSEYSGSYVTLKDNIDEIIAREMDRRRSVFQRFLSNGSVLQSSAYGKITLSPDQNLLWTGFNRLVPSVIPVSAGHEGYIEFRLGMTKELSSSYEGVVSFQLTGMPKDRFINFLYSFSQNGVKFSYVPEKEIRNNTVLQEASTPLIIFFSFAP